jgi:hypothetical protein
MAKQKDIEFKYNKWGIIEVYENGDYAGVIAIIVFVLLAISSSPIDIFSIY